MERGSPLASNLDRLLLCPLADLSHRIGVGIAVCSRPTPNLQQGLKISGAICTNASAMARESNFQCRKLGRFLSLGVDDFPEK